MKLKILIALLCFIVLFFASSLFLVKKKVFVDHIYLIVRDGEPAEKIVEDLYEKKIITNKIIFKLYLRFNRYTQNLSKGKYFFNGDYSMSDIAKSLVYGKVFLRKVTIPEGFTIQETCKRLVENGFGKYYNYIKLCNDKEFIFSLTDMDVKTLEGFLYPETYYFADDTSEEDILKAMVKMFKKKTANINFYRLKFLNYYEILTLASIIEEEALYKDEMPTIASVYINRLKQNSLLQADPTVVYLLKKENNFRGKVYYKDLKIDSKYNTYKYKGLPPTPICSPSRNAINGVINHKDTKYLFFVAGDDGKHIFTKTYREHLKVQRD